MAANPVDLIANHFAQIADAIVSERKPAAPRGRSSIHYQWTDYGNVNFTAVVTYNYDADGDYTDGTWWDASTIDLCTGVVTHINGKSVAEFAIDPNDIPGCTDALYDAIREYELESRR